LKKSKTLKEVGRNYKNLKKGWNHLINVRQLKGVLKNSKK